MLRIRPDTCPLEPLDRQGDGRLVKAADVNEE